MCEAKLHLIKSQAAKESRRKGPGFTLPFEISQEALVPTGSPPPNSNTLEVKVLKRRPLGEHLKSKLQKIILTFKDKTNLELF